MLLKGALLLVLAMPALAEDDPELAAALAKCPGAAQFRQHHPHEDAPPEQEAAPPTDPALRKQLLDMVAPDQQARDAVNAAGWSRESVEAMSRVDAANLPRIKRIVEAHAGLPLPSEVGQDGVDAAWLLVQHADADPAFQAQVLDQVQSRVGHGGLRGQDFILLTDRVLTNQGKPQRYGSQLIPRDGKWVPKPLEDPAQVDARRAAVGQMPLADYLCVASQMFQPPAQQ